MKIHQIILSACFIGAIGTSHSQISGFGVQTKLNMSRHQYKNPLQPEHGTSGHSKIIYLWL